MPLIYIKAHNIVGDPLAIYGYRVPLTAQATPPSRERGAFLFSNLFI